MSLIALTAAKSAGVTTSALALAGVWPTPVLLAECDPAGGDVNAGLLRGAPAAGGLLDLALATRRGLTPDQFWAHTVAVSEDGTVRLLPGLADPAQHPALTPAWPLLIRMLHALDLPPPIGSAESVADRGWDVLADCGRLAPCTPMGLLGAADLVLLVLRPRLAHVAHTRSRLSALRGQIANHSGGLPPELSCCSSVPAPIGQPRSRPHWTCRSPVSWQTTRPLPRYWPGWPGVAPGLNAHR